MSALFLSTYFSFFFFNDTATTEIYTLSLHDALPISRRAGRGSPAASRPGCATLQRLRAGGFPQCRDRKSTRLNSSHLGISYAVFCLKKKKKKEKKIKQKTNNKSSDNHRDRTQ